MLFEMHQKHIAVILEELKKHSMRWSPLLNKWIVSDGGIVQFSKVMRWMCKKGYVKKVDPSSRTSPYEITEAGEKYLEGLKA